MAISVHAVGSWTQLTTNGATYTLPSNADGDRLVMYVTYKDRNTTSSISGWTEHETHTDGSVAAGNGVGSMRSKFFWLDRGGSAPSDPAITLGATVIGAWVCYTLRKGAGETWDAPIPDTPATAIDLTLSWTTTETITAAGAALTEDVKDGSIVICGVGIRDDSATFTRNTAGIDDSGGLITWNGNYVENPATHFSTTTGNDAAADIGYRLITTGTTSAVTLRTRGTLSAAETGSGIFFIQGVTVAGDITLQPTPVVLDMAVPAPTLALANDLALTPVVLDMAVPAPTVNLALTIALAPVVLDMAVPAPNLIADILLQPTPVVLDLTVPTPTLAQSLTLALAPVVLDMAVPTPNVNLALTLSPAPVPVDLAVAAPTIDLGAVTLNVAPVPVDLTVPAPTVNQVLILTPTPVAVDLGVPEPDLIVEGGTITLQPGPVVLTLSVPAPLLDVEIGIVSGSDHQLIRDSIEFYEAYDVADEPTRRLLMRDFLLTHGGRMYVDTNGIQYIVGGTFPSRYP